MEDFGAELLRWVNLHLIAGIIVGCIYALGAIGISLVFSILRFAHFAHGDLMTLGAFLALAIVTSTGMEPILALPLAAIGAAAITVVIDKLFYRPLRTSSTIVLLISSVGVALMVRSAIQVVFGPDVHQYAVGFERPMEFFEPLILKETRLYIIGATIVLISGMHYLLAYTRIGKAMRATSDDPDLSRATGINTEMVISATWICAAVLAASAGVLIGMDTNVKPELGFNLLLPMFAAAIVGGLGRPYGAIAGGMLIGIIEEISTAYYFDFQLLTADYKSAIAFAIMVIMLIFRPTGLFKGKVL
jgi:branched-chain amino acid transport system permease protein